MKKLFLTLVVAFLATYGFSQNPPSMVINVDNGLTYVRILNVQEYLSVGGSIVGEPLDPAAKKKYSGSQIACKPGGGCCWHSVVESGPLGELGMITIVEQTGDDGTFMPETTGLYAYYNSEIDEIILYLVLRQK